MTPHAADEGAQNNLTKNILTTTKVSLMKFAERAISSLSQQTIATHLVYLALMLFFVSTFMWCSFAINLRVVALQKKQSSGSHKVGLYLTENRTVGVVVSRRWGALHCFCPRAPKTLVTPLCTVA